MLVARCIQQKDLRGRSDLVMMTNNIKIRWIAQHGIHGRSACTFSPKRQAFHHKLPRTTCASSPLYKLFCTGCVVCVPRVKACKDKKGSNLRADVSTPFFLYTQTNPNRYSFAPSFVPSFLRSFFRSFVHGIVHAS